MVELRKRKAASEAAPPSMKKANSVKSIPSSEKAESSTNGSASNKAVCIFAYFRRSTFLLWIQLQECTAIEAPIAIKRDVLKLSFNHCQ